MIASRKEDMLDLQVCLDDGLSQCIHPEYKCRLETQESGTKRLRHFRNQACTSYEHLLAARMGTLKCTKNGLGQPQEE